jgi:hypothetical protein
VKNVVDAMDGAGRDLGMCQIAWQEFDFRQMRQVLASAGNEAVHDANAFAAPDELFAQVRSDETGAAGDEVQGHGLSLLREAGSRKTGDDSQGVLEVQLLQDRVRQ